MKVLPLKQNICLILSMMANHKRLMGDFVEVALMINPAFSKKDEGSLEINLSHRFKSPVR